MKKIGFTLISCYLLIATVSLSAQVLMQKIESPVLNSDKSVTFYIKAPNAEKVELNAQFLKENKKMVKDEKGIWSITVDHVKPDIYPYAFIVDGMQIADPNNMNIFPNEGFKYSLVEIPGEPTSVYALKDVPHGKVTYCYYNSKSMKVTRPIVVYTPPGYEESNKKYPVLYLISGTTDTEETWFKVGRANFIIDNLIASGKAEPMIIAMPYGNTLTGTPHPSSPESAKMYKVFDADLIGSMIPYVEENFRVKADRDNRAIAGFSRGGGQTLFSAFSNLDIFSWVGSYSAYLTTEVFEKYFSDVTINIDNLNSKINLFWLGVGKDDFLYKPAVEFNKLLSDKKIKHTELITEGGHTWMNARHYLTETLQKYFK